MTRNQIMYQELQATIRRDAVNATVALGNLDELKRHNSAVETETNRHNLVVEEQATKQLGINQQQADAATMNAETNRLNYGVNLMNAETNRLNYGVNAMNAQTNRMNAETNRFIAQYQQALGYENLGVAQQNADTNARQAAVAERQANIAEGRFNMDTFINSKSLDLKTQQVKNDTMRAETDYLNGIVQRSVWKTQGALNKAKVNESNANAGYKLEAGSYLGEQNTRAWIDTIKDVIFGGAKAFSWKALNSMLGSVSQFDLLGGLIE